MRRNPVYSYIGVGVQRSRSFKTGRAQSDYGTLVSRLPAEGKGSAADWEKLIPDLQKFISEHRDTAPALDARIELAKAFFETKRYGDAIKTGEEALSLAPAVTALDLSSCISLAMPMSRPESPMRPP